MKEFLKRNEKHILFIVYIIITAIFTFLHETWRDEAQAWLIARDLSFVDIIKQMQYEGHPCLWHLVLAPFAKIGLPFCTISIINLMFMYASAWLIIYKTKLKNIFKILILFSVPFLYYYPVVARCYSLMCFLMVLISIIYKSRRKYPIIFGLLLLLLTNTHVIAAAFTGIIMFTFYMKEIFINKSKDKRIIIGFIIALIGFVFLVGQLYMSLEMCSIRSISTADGSVEKVLEYFMKFLEFFWYIANIYTPLNNLKFIISALISLTLISFILQVPKNKCNEILIFWITLLFILFVNIFIYCNASQRSGICIILLLFLCINYNREKSNKEDGYAKIELATKIICLISVVGAIELCFMEFKYAFSYSEETAKYINENCAPDSIFVSDTPDMNLAIIPLLNENTKFYNLKTDIYFTYTTWNYDVHANIYEDEIKSDIESLGIKENVYYIRTYGSYNVNNDMEDIIDRLVKEEYLEMVYENYYHNDGTITDETYVIYKIKGIEYD